MLNYIIISSCAYWFVSIIGDMIINKRIESIGYVSKKETKKTLGTKVGGIAISLLPVINNILTLLMIAMLSLNNSMLEKLCRKSSGFIHASAMKEEIDYKKRHYNLDEIQDSLKIEGATDEAINQVIKDVKTEIGSYSDKEYNKLSAMTDAELWLFDIEMNVGLTPEEKRQLYMDYVKDFANNKENAKAKAIQKTLKLFDKREE